jgi:hypothetical protein
MTLHAIIHTHFYVGWPVFTRYRYIGITTNAFQVSNRYYELVGSVRNKQEMRGRN